MATLTPFSSHQQGQKSDQGLSGALPDWEVTKHSISNDGN